MSTGLTAGRIGSRPEAPSSAVLARQAEYSDARIAARYQAELRALVGAL